MLGASTLPTADDDTAAFCPTTQAQPLAACFHCGESIPRGTRVVARVQNSERNFCCEGCRAVAELIAGEGLEDYYRYRDRPAARPSDQNGQPWSAYDGAELSAQYTRSEGDDRRSTVLLLDGLRCAACSWLIEKALRRHPGVIEVHVNSASARGRIVWSDAQTSFAAILAAISRLGYRPIPLSASAVMQAAQSERRAALKRLAVAGLGMMQVMMFAVALYVGTDEMDGVIRQYLRSVSWLVATPVLLYAGRPFFNSAVRALRARTVNMDVPVAIALCLAYGASVWNTLQQRGEVYFDSVTMFIFFLTVGRYVEMLVRHRTGDETEALARLLPRIAHRVNGATIEDIAADRLCVGDRVLVRVGEIIPADGQIVAGTTTCDEALLTGESTPRARVPGDPLIAGALNVQAPFTLRVTAIGSAMVLSGIVALLDKAQTEKPQVARAADRAAAWFLRRVLIGAVLVGAAWLWFDPSRAFDTVLAVLVVTCPCALSLATPAVLSTATAALARRGLLITRSDAIEQLAAVDCIVFDKTGTLTEGKLGIESCRTFGSIDASRCYAIAAALEQAAEHPIARAFIPHATEVRAATDVHIVSGHGVEGCVDGRRFRIGSAAFVSKLCVHPDGRSAGDSDEIFLGDVDGLQAGFRVTDTLRHDAAEAIAQLRELGIDSLILSGDSWLTVKQIAKQTGISKYEARLTPAGKLKFLSARVADGAHVAVVGDGVNDAPMLRAAPVSVAMSGGAALAQANADAVLMSTSLRALPQAIAVARRAKTAMRQNLAWAVFYNLCALPVAALGIVPPWLAAIGMSLSSTVVVANALRLSPRERHAVQDASNDAVTASRSP